MTWSFKILYCFLPDGNDILKFHLELNSPVRSRLYPKIFLNHLHFISINEIDFGNNWYFIYNKFQFEFFLIEIEASFPTWGRRKWTPSIVTEISCIDCQLSDLKLKDLINTIQNFGPDRRRFSLSLPEWLWQFLCHFYKQQHTMNQWLKLLSDDENH